MQLVQAVLSVDKFFESGLRLPRGTPVRVELGERIYKHNCDGFGNGRCGPEQGCGYTNRYKPGVAHYYDSPNSYSTHCFVVTDEEYSILVRAKTDEWTIEEVSVEQ